VGGWVGGVGGLRVSRLRHPGSYCCFKGGCVRHPSTSIDPPRLHTTNRSPHRPPIRQPLERGRHDEGRGEPQAPPEPRPVEQVVERDRPLQPPLQHHPHLALLAAQEGCRCGVLLLGGHLEHHLVGDGVARGRSDVQAFVGAWWRFPAVVLAAAVAARDDGNTA